MFYKGIVTEYKMKITRRFAFIAYSWVQYFTFCPYRLIDESKKTYKIHKQFFSETSSQKKIHRNRSVANVKYCMKSNVKYCIHEYAINAKRRVIFILYSVSTIL